MLIKVVVVVIVGMILLVINLFCEEGIEGMIIDFFLWNGVFDVMRFWYVLNYDFLLLLWWIIIFVIFFFNKLYISGRNVY